VDINFLCDNWGDYALFYWLSCSVDVSRIRWKSKCHVPLLL